MNCVVCEREFEPRNARSKLCSRDCIGEFNRRRIAGTRDENKWEKFECAICGKECERRKLQVKKTFCSKSCRGKFFIAQIAPKLHATTYEVMLDDGTKMNVKSRWEAAFIKDYLEKNKLTWHYEPKKFQLKSGLGYTPDLYVDSEDVWVEIKGCIYYDRFNKVDAFRNEHPELNYVVADHDVLTGRFGLNLSQVRLHEVSAQVQER